MITEDVVYDVVCFNSCSACIPMGEGTGCTDSNAQNYDPDATIDNATCEYLITFQVDLSQTGLQIGETVYVAGDFNDWCGDCLAMTDDDEDNIWEYTAQVQQGQTFFKYTINGWDGTVEEFDGTESCVGLDGDFYNRVIDVDADFTTPAYCFDQCEECTVQVPVLIVFQVLMANENISPDGVYVVGDFNDWDATTTQMTDIGGGLYQAGVFMFAGESTNYKFLNGPDFVGEESVPMECGVENGFGGYDRFYEAGETTETLEPVCFSGCGPCVITPTVTVTLQVDMAEQDVSPEGIYLAGSFNDFSPNTIQMVNQVADIYTATVTVMTNINFEYKYLNGPSFDNSET
ncbi:MAG: hypothetical protein AAF193_12040, partial [Bacteroidota bacterium]